MSIRLENADKPESIVGLEEVWLGNRGGNHISVFSLVMGGRRGNVLYFQKRKLKRHQKSIYFYLLLISFMP